MTRPMQIDLEHPGGFAGPIGAHLAPFAIGRELRAANEAEAQFAHVQHILAQPEIENRIKAAVKILGSAEQKCIDPRATGQPIIAGPAVDDVIAIVAAQDVIPRAAAQIVVAKAPSRLSLPASPFSVSLPVPP